MLKKLLKETITAVTAQRTKLALIVRADLKMSKGKVAAQCAHAAVLCYQQSLDNRDKQKLLASWTIKGQPKIVLRVETYVELEQLQQRAKQLGVMAPVVRDAGRTQLEPGTATVLGLGPDSVELIDKLVAHLKLL